MKERTHLLIILLMLVMGMLIILSGCGNVDSLNPETSYESTKTTVEEKTSLIAQTGISSSVSYTESTETAVEEKKYLSAQTNILYMAGNESNWSYGNQRKEFSNFEACYVRIGSTAITNGFLGKGVGDEITITYRFTGAERCKIEISDGKVTNVETGNPNAVEFARTINAANEKKAEENFVIFRYTPNNAESVALEVIYDGQIAEKYDALSTIYFEKVPASQNNIH